VIARARHAEGRLEGVVGTLMSNLGFEHAIRRLGVGFERAKVGDRYVLELLQERGWKLGGENSGHILCLDRHSTGDGIISALQVLAALRSGGTDLVDACAELEFYPQVLINVRLTGGFDWKSDSAIADARDTAEAALGDRGRVLLRPSGTEPLLRVMVEGQEREQVELHANRIAEAVRRSMEH